MVPVHKALLLGVCTCRGSQWIIVCVERTVDALLVGISGRGRQGQRRHDATRKGGSAAITTLRNLPFDHAGEHAIGFIHPDNIRFSKGLVRSNSDSAEPGLRIVLNGGGKLLSGVSSWSISFSAALPLCSHLRCTDHGTVVRTSSVQTALVVADHDNNRGSKDC
jgi:hypothetical protein